MYNFLDCFQGAVSATFGNKEELWVKIQESALCKWFISPLSFLACEPGVGVMQCEFKRFGLYSVPHKYTSR